MPAGYAPRDPGKRTAPRVRLPQSSRCLDVRICDFAADVHALSTGYILLQAFALLFEGEKSEERRLLQKMERQSKRSDHERTVVLQAIRCALGGYNGLDVDLNRIQATVDPTVLLSFSLVSPLRSSKTSSQGSSSQTFCRDVVMRKQCGHEIRSRDSAREWKAPVL